MRRGDGCGACGRRGELAATILVTAVIALFFLVLALLIYKAIATRQVPVQNDAQCQAQVASHAKIAQLTEGRALPKINCPTRLVSLKTNDEAVVKKELAGQMKRCWDIWGRGELRLFGKDEGMYCHVCSLVTVDGVKEVRGLPLYLEEEDATPTQKYSQYLAGYTEGTLYNKSDLPKLANVTLQTNESVGVIFYYAKGLSGFNRLRNSVLGNGGVTGTGGAVAGGLIMLGTSVMKTGIGIKVGAVLTITGVVVGGATGLAASLWGTADTDYMSVIVVRPLTQADVKDLGCQYSAATD